MSSTENKRIAVVTGGNKGIGYETVRGLAKSGNFERIYLTARNEKCGVDAANTLCKEESTDRIHYHSLDITNTTSIITFAEFLKTEHNGLDVLVQNAGVLFDQKSTVSVEDQARKTIETNFWGTLNVMKNLADMVKPNGRIVLVSSVLSHTAQFDFKPHWFINPIAKKLNAINKKVALETIEQLATQYTLDVQNGNKDNGWPSHAYGISKLLVNNITRVYAANMTKKNIGILVNCCCPGFVETDMTVNAPDKGKGKPPIEGAQTSVYLALVPAGMAEPHGRIILDA